MQPTISELEAYIKSHFLHREEAQKITNLVLQSAPIAPEKGVHLWLLNVSRVLQCSLKYNKAFTKEALTIATKVCHRQPTEKEIDDAVEAPFRTSSPKRLADLAFKNTYTTHGKENDKLIHSIFETSDLTVSSWEDDTLKHKYCYAVLQSLAFPPDSWIAFGWDIYSNWKAYKLGDPTLLKRDYPNWLVPNALIAETGLTAKGKPFARAASNVNKILYIVVEWDKFNLDQQAKLIGHFPQEKIHMILYSGGDSLHCWLYVGNLFWEQILHIRFLALSLGCCPSTVNNPVEPVRMPNVFRNDKNKIQRLIYLKAKETK